VLKQRLLFVQAFADQQNKLNLATAAKSLILSISGGLHTWLFACTRSAEFCGDKG
jgi:hypothetical protein